MHSTLPKQFLYGLGYVIVFAGLGYVFYLGFLKPAPTCSDGIQNQGETETDCGGSACISCAIIHLKPVTASAEIVGSGEAAVVLVTLANPNAAYGLQTLTYAVRLIAADGSPVGELERESFLYPGEIRRILALGMAGVAAAARVEASAAFVNESWQPLAVFPLPQVSVRQKAVAPADDGAFTLSGIIRNENPFVLSRLTLVAVAQDPGGSPASASQTLLQDLAPFSERFFSIAFPRAGSLPPASGVEVFVEAQR